MNKSRKLFSIVVICIFAFMLFLNFLTPKIADDYNYAYSFATQTKLNNVFDIFTSLKSHWLYINGRLAPHFFAHLFNMMPKWIFNIINSFMFVIQALLIYKISQKKDTVNKLSPLFLAGIFFCLWVFVPSFGTVNLWLDGACNYLWNIVLCLIYIIPFINLYLYHEKLNNIFLQIIWVILGFLVGNFGENSAPPVFITAFILLLLYFIKTKKVQIYMIASFVTGAAGFLFMALSPGETKNKVTEFSLYFLRTNFMNALNKYFSLWYLIAALTIAFALAFVYKIDKKKIILSALFTLASLISNFMLALASYYSLRSACYCAVFLIVALFILVNELITEKTLLPLISCGIAVLLVYGTYQTLLGVNDIYVTYSDDKENIEYIYDCIEKGEKDVVLKCIHPTTTYSPVYGLWYVRETKNEWPNNQMAKYYGLDSITGENR